MKTSGFTTKEVLHILHRIGLDLDAKRLYSWIDRQVVKLPKVGPGVDRHYSLYDLVFIASLVFVTSRTPVFRRSRGETPEELVLARWFAKQVHTLLAQAASGGQFNSDDYPALVLVPDQGGVLQFEEVPVKGREVIWQMYATRGAMIAHVGHFAANLGFLITKTFPADTEG